MEATASEPAAMVDLQLEHERLRQENQQLHLKLQDREKLKQELHERRQASKKLSNQRDKLKSLLEKRHPNSTSQQELHRKREDSSSVASSNGLSDWESSTSDASYLDTDKMSHTWGGTGAITRGGGGDNLTLLKTQLGALRLENATLVKEKRKGDEQRDGLVQELAALNTKYERQQEKCDRLQAENQRLSLVIGARQSSDQTPSAQEEDIELLKAQVCIYQEDCKAQLAMTQTAEKANERLKAELNEARAIIRELKMSSPCDLSIYHPESDLQPVYQQVGYVPRGPGYTRRPLGYYDPLEPGLTRSYSGSHIGPSRNNILRCGVAPARKAFLSPDMTAVVDSRDGVATFQSI